MSCPARILRPGPHNHNSLTTTTGEESASGTTPEFSSTSASPAVVSLAYNINASRSQFQQITDRRDNHSTSSLSISNVPNPNPELFFSSTPDDIRASTVQLSMLAFLPPQPPTPLAHSNYLKPNGPASFPLQRDWSPPKPPTTGNDGVTSGDMSGAGQSSYTDPRTQFRGILNPSQIRTPVTGADLATLGGRSGVSKPYQKLAGTLRGNEAGTIHRAGSPQSHDVITGDTRETVAEPGVRFSYYIFRRLILIFMFMSFAVFVFLVPIGSSDSNAKKPGPLSSFSSKFCLRYTPPFFYPSVFDPSEPGSRQLSSIRSLTSPCQTAEAHKCRRFITNYAEVRSSRSIPT